MQASSQKSFVDLFYDAYKKVAPNNSLAPLFATLENKSKIKNTASDQEVLQFIKDEAASAFDRSFKILRTRIDQFGVTQPVIQNCKTAVSWLSFRVLTILSVCVSSCKVLPSWSSGRYMTTSRHTNTLKPSIKYWQPTMFP